MRDQILQAAQQAAASCEHNPSVRNIRSQLRRCLLQNTVDRLHDLNRRLVQCLFRLLRGHLHGARQTRHQITPSYIHIVYFRPLVGGTDLYLQILCRPFTDQQIMFLTHVTHDRLIEIVSRDLNGSADNRTAQGNYRDIGSAAADIHDHIAAGLGNVNPCTDRRSNGLLYDGDLSGARLISGILNRLLLYFRNTAWHTDRNAGFPECLLTQSLLDKIFHHLLCYLIVRDNTLSQRPYRHDIARGPAQHQPRVLADRLDLVRVSIKSYNRRLFQYDALAPDVDQYAGCSQINSDICILHSL